MANDTGKTYFTAGEEAEGDEVLVNATMDIVLERSHLAHHNRSAQDVLDQYVTPVICTFGFVGNLVNLVVLTRRHFRKTDSGKETTARLGLILLAVSDMLFCLVLFPRVFVRTTRSAFDSRSFALYYQAYGAGLVNTFIFTSTWITVGLATLRYLGICHPFKARLIQDVAFTKLVYSLIFLFCAGFNMPWYWHYDIKHVEVKNNTVYLLVIGYFDEHSVRGTTFKWFRACLGIFLPAILLLFCNFSLICALRRSFRLRKQFHVKDSVSRTRNRITLLLVVIAILFVLLVFPSELLDFFLTLVVSNTVSAESFLLARAITNLLQVVNFAFNFLLYCGFSTHFRAVLYDMVTCSKRHDVIDNGSALRGRHFSLRRISFKTSRTLASVV